MSTFALVITCIAGLCSFALLVAGYAALLSQEQSEVADLRRRYEQLSFRGALPPIQRWMSVCREALPISRVVAHWRTRPEVRRLIWLGLLFFVIPPDQSAELTAPSRSSSLTESNGRRIARSIAGGMALGAVTAAVGIAGEMLRYLNCITVWIFGVCAFTLLLPFIASHRAISVGAATLTAYLLIIPYTAIHDLARNRWDAADSVPMFFFTFGLLVLLPSGLIWLFEHHIFHASNKT